MTLTPAEERRASEIERLGGTRRLLPEELAEYNELAIRAYNRKRRLRGEPPEPYPFLPKIEQ